MRVHPRPAPGWRRAALIALLALACAGCAGPPAAAERADAPPPPTTAAPPTAAPASVGPEPRPSAAPAPTAAPAPSPSPDPQRPPRVGIQVGHWKIEDHADEMARLRKFSGGFYRGYDEWEVNIVIAQAVQQQLEAAGVRVDLLPARIPIGYEADAFLSIHADGVSGPTAATRRGWKVATPFRASPASEQLAEALRAAYPAVTGMPYDPEEASIRLRAYYAFASYRYWHTVAPTTPAAIIECGFMTHPADRELLFERPELIGEGIARGILDFLQASYPLSAAERAPVGRGVLRATRANVPMHERASEESPVLIEVGPDDQLAPMDERDGWALVFNRAGDWDLGWVRLEDLVETGEPLTPRHPRPAE